MNKKMSNTVDIDTISDGLDRTAISDDDDKLCTSCEPKIEYCKDSNDSNSKQIDSKQIDDNISNVSDKKMLQDPPTKDLNKMPTTLEKRLDDLLSTAQEETAHIDLFAPITDRKECPICMIPVPVNDSEITFMSCCGKSICNGCIYKHMMNNRMNKIPAHEQKCAFCCQPTNRRTAKDGNKSLKKLMKNNVPEAFIQRGKQYKTGIDMFQSDTKSMEMYIRAAELGHTKAFDVIASYYEEGIAVGEDVSKAQEFWVVAAKKGSIAARMWLLGCGTDEEMIKHLELAANTGHQESMDAVMKLYRHNIVSKDYLTQVLRTFQASSNELKSKDRDDARAYVAANGHEGWMG